MHYSKKYIFKKSLISITELSRLNFSTILKCFLKYLLQDLCYMKFDSSVGKASEDYFFVENYVSSSLTGGQFLYRDMAIKFIINLIRIFRDTMVKSKEYHIKL